MGERADARGPDQRVELAAAEHIEQLAEQDPGRRVDEERQRTEAEDG